MLHANCTENIMTRFYNQTKPILKDCIYLFMLPWKRHIRELKAIKKTKFVLLTCLLPFLAIKGSRVLEKKVNEAQESKTVFSHLYFEKKDVHLTHSLVDNSGEWQCHVKLRRNV